MEKFNNIIKKLIPKNSDLQVKVKVISQYLKVKVLDIQDGSVESEI